MSNEVKLVILDIDGVMTDGTKLYGVDGMPFAKSYCDKDFTAIKRMRGAGVKVCFLSGDDTVNLKMAQNRNIDFYSARGKDKAEFLPMLEKVYGVNRKDMVYLGDDLFDLSIMKAVGHPYCPYDACFEVTNFCGYMNTLSSSGGRNAIVHLQRVLLQRRLISDCTIQEIEKLDKKETF
jgi:3-deoxy-D-manno-octulosonate 8-phosphate phosphatase (KDO 8-P phosphatase)